MHLRWGYSKVESPFLSVFGDREEAMRWARARQDWLDKQTSVLAGVKLFQIDCNSLGQSVVFKVDDLLARLDIPLNRDTSHEYLILHRIPANAIRLDVDISDMVFQGEQANEGLEEEARSEAESWVQRANDPRHHWVDDLHGYYDSDEECEEHNTNDDLMKMLEGDW
ncbi:hypothetical protein LTR37_011048 [Vermiconidia calcicola]|uniref:Uncharacterized protein n=1 Tax=Vermiconidia calcicola TaxID=1690605 RepID=A0ACC3N3E9_9PEZI|nr:hypothetical protein LTR37_011048 [Vermiconidia calcicola]